MTTTQFQVAGPTSNVTHRSKPATLDLAAVIAGCLIFALLLFLPPILNDGDTLWQIRAGEWILDHHAIPATDPFSFTAGDRPWFSHEWLAETLMALAYRAGGLKGVMVLAAAATGLTAGVLLHHLRRFLPGDICLTGLGRRIVLRRPLDARPPTSDRLAVPGAVVRWPRDGASESHRARLGVAVGHAGCGSTCMAASCLGCCCLAPS